MKMMKVKKEEKDLMIGMLINSKDLMVKVDNQRKMKMKKKKKDMIMNMTMNMIMNIHIKKIQLII
jgi:hypothetical protein